MLNNGHISRSDFFLLKRVQCVFLSNCQICQTTCGFLKIVKQSKISFAVVKEL